MQIFFPFIYEKEEKELISEELALTIEPLNFEEKDEEKTEEQLTIIIDIF